MAVAAVPWKIGKSQRDQLVNILRNLAELIRKDLTKRIRKDPAKSIWKIQRNQFGRIQRNCKHLAESIWKDPVGLDLVGSISKKASESIGEDSTIDSKRFRGIDRRPLLKSMVLPVSSKLIQLSMLAHARAQLVSHFRHFRKISKQ